MRLPLQEKDKTHLELHVHNLIQAGVISIFERNKLVLQIPTKIFIHWNLKVYLDIYKTEINLDGSTVISEWLSLKWEDFSRIFCIIFPAKNGGSKNCNVFLSEMTTAQESVTYHSANYRRKGSCRKVMFSVVCVCQLVCSRRGGLTIQGHGTGPHVQSTSPSSPPTNIFKFG